jgi:hypothetical protein
LKVSNTQLAAALVTIGYEILPSTDWTSREVIFEFDNRPEIAWYEGEWRKLLTAGADTTGGPEERSDPMPLLARTAKARQWIMQQVIHGNHNEGLELPEATMTTDNLHMAICFVAQGKYLLKLDKATRLFHFDKSLESLREQFCNPRPGDDFYYCRSYLRELIQLTRKINDRNLTRQQNQPAITCAQ